MRPAVGFLPCAATGHKSVGPEGPPTTSQATQEPGTRSCGRGFSPDAFRSAPGDPTQKHRA
ncbi:DUF6053 domain-containing protein [Lysobacter enzymogenes]|uniref:DUF6053 domain-containing protein n=1 Tax=Lysobacter enzymogenes TaxID=69 RepID=UPI003D18C0AC